MQLIKLFSREYSVQYTEASLRSLGSEVREHLPALLMTQSYLPEPPNETCYADEKEWKQLLQALNEQYATEEPLKDLIKNFHQYGTAYVECSQRLGEGVSSVDSNDTLIQYYQEYETALILYSAYLWMGYLLNNSYTEKGREILNKKVFDQRDVIETALFSPIQRSGILELQHTLSELKQQQSDLSSEQLKTIVHQYSWMSCLDIQNNPWSATDLEPFFATIKSSTPLLPFNEAAERAHLSSEEQQFFKNVRELVYVKDMRDEYRRKGVCAILPLFDEIARRVHVSRKELAYFTSAEIMEELQAGARLDSTTARARKNGFLLHWIGSTIHATADQKEIERFVTDRCHSGLTGIRSDPGQARMTVSIKGTSACAGIAKGIVKIVRGVNDLNKIQVGDVMVAITTHPDFVPAMHRAVAIVTDEGGLTSHAAIVSRELQIPCIVGTKNATQILHDGDQVLVDAFQGTVTLE